MTFAPAFSSDTIRETFHAWNAERDSLDAELSESLAALEAYQHHLDEWQQQLACEREDLQHNREQFELNQANAEKNQSEASAATIAELHDAREKITALTTLLLNRTEELRTLDNRRAEAQTELELARARERELKSALDDHKQLVEQERSQRAEEITHLREMIERQLDTPAVEEPVLPVGPVASPPQAASVAAPSSSPSSGDGTQPLQRESPVLGSIVEQFGKLRQQRAVERQANNKQR